MKKYIIHIISLVLLTFFYGCSKEELQVSFTSNGGSRTLTLTLTHAGMESRATPDGEDDLNENAINRVDLFLYPTDKTNSNAVFSKTGITTFTSKDDKVVINLDVPMSAVEALFPNGVNTCEAYVIVNRPTESAIPEKTDMASLKAISITSPFDSKVDKEGNAIEQYEFVMDGYSTRITYADDAISGSIAAERSAAKITLTITGIEKDLTDEGGTKWIPLPGQMQVMFYNGVKTSQVNTKSVPVDGVYFNLGPDKGRGFTDSEVEVEVNGVKETQTHYNHAIPFYSYPSDWSKQTPDKEAHMVLMLPWEANGQQTNFYYEVPIDDINKKLVRNTYYQIKLVVGVLGSTELNDEIVKLTPNCILLNWGEEQINAELDQPRYLVAEDVIKIYNQNSVKISFESSHDVEILNSDGKNIITYHPDLSSVKVNEDQYSFTSTDDGIFNNSTKGITLSVDNNSRVVNYSKTLNNTFNDPNFDFTEYRTVLTIRHIGNTKKELEKQITIIQYPAIYGEVEVNTDYYATPGNPNSGTSGYNNDNGFVWVNGYQGGYNSNNPQDYFCRANGISGTDECANRLIFNITSTQGTNYIIGDPRTTAIDNTLIDAKCKYRGNNFNTSNSYTAWVQANALYDNNSSRGLKYYYPTDVDYTSSTTMENSRTKNMIAPRFMVASSYGAIYPSDHAPRRYLDAIRKRCASYQEDGYPAGRWRVPTEAELRFLVYLDNGAGKIPDLYDNMAYWSAHGYGIVDGTNVNMEYSTDRGSTSVSVRCVYDLWYWEDRLPDSQRDVFTWGDYPRNDYPPTN